MHPEDEIQATIALSLIPGIGAITARKILNQTGSAVQFFTEIKRLKITASRLQALRNADFKSLFLRSEKELRFIEKQEINTYLIHQNNYPRRLKLCEDAPPVLFSRGKMDLDAPKIIAVVGTRKATEYGLKCCEDVLEELGKNGCSLISGLAYGIDTHAHKEASKRGIQNLGVVAHGLDRVYPFSNKSLAKKMEEYGGLISDFISETPPDRENFPKRNRLVAGLADAVIVVEASLSGGALITAEIANSYNRDVFALPGSWGREFSVGCNNLVKNNKAAILSSAADLSWYLNWDKPESPKAIQTQILFDLSQNEELLINAIKGKADTLDSISIETDMPVSKASALLLNLEFRGIIKTLPGKRYQILS
jgi:DNA processing protein